MSMALAYWTIMFWVNVTSSWFCWAAVELELEPLADAPPDPAVVSAAPQEATERVMARAAPKAATG